LKPDKKYWLEDMPRFRMEPTGQLVRGGGVQKKLKKGEKKPPDTIIYKYRHPLNYGENVGCAYLLN